MKRALRYAALAILLIFGWLFLAAFFVRAFAHSVMLDNGTEFHFDTFCCNGEDCQEVPLSAITLKGDAWQVDYIDRRTGKRVHGYIRENTVGHKWSPNHQVFACRQPVALPDGSYAPRCIYPQKPGM